MLLFILFPRFFFNSFVQEFHKDERSNFVYFCLALAFPPLSSKNFPYRGVDFRKRWYQLR